MPVYIICGKCNCPRLARCELAAGRLMLHWPNVFVEFEMRDPEEYHSHLGELKRKYKFNEEAWQGIDKQLVVYTREGLLIGDDINFFNLLVSKYKLPQEEPDILKEEMPELIIELARVNEEQFKEAISERRIGPGILAEVKRRCVELLLAEMPPRVLEDVPPAAATHTAKAPTNADSATGAASYAATSPISVSAAPTAETMKISLARGKFDTHASPAGSRPENATASASLVVMGPADIASRPFPLGEAAAAPAAALQHVDLLSHNHKSALLHFYAPQHVRVTHAIHNGLEFLVWEVAGLRQRNQANMALRTRFQHLADAFVLDSMLPRKEASVNRTHYVVLADEPMVQQHFFVVPKKYLITVTDRKVLDCFRTRKKICCFYSKLHQAPVCRALAELVCAPDACVTLRSSYDENEDEPDRMKVLFDCEKVTFTLSEDDDIDEFAADAATEVEKYFSSSQQNKEMSFYMREKFYRLHRRLVRDVFRGLLPDDWEALKEILDNNNVIAAFQFLPERWPDHRRPIDTHIHILPLPLEQNTGEQTRGKAVNFLFERQIETALQQQLHFLKDLDLLHVLVPIVAEDGPPSATEGTSRSRNEYEVAFWKAHRVLQLKFSPQFNLNLTGFSLIVSKRFLLLVPHNAPQLEDTFCCEVLTHAIWHKWPVPHPVAYLGGPIIIPTFKKQWTPYDDIAPRLCPIVYAAVVDEDPDEIDFSKYGGKSHGAKERFVQRVCVHENAHNRPLDILKLFCLKGRASDQERKWK